MTTVDVEVIFSVRNDTGELLGTIRDTEFEVRLTDDSVQIAASNLAYGLVEEAWGLVDDDD